MAFIQIRNVEIKGISACVPQRIERNRDYPYLSAEEIEKMARDEKFAGAIC